MGWGNCGTDSKGRPIGYNFPAVCDEPGCEVEIDRGLAFACGGMHGEDGSVGYCEGYFCEAHRHGDMIWPEDRDRTCQHCHNGNAVHSADAFNEAHPVGSRFKFLATQPASIVTISAPAKVCRRGEGLDVMVEIDSEIEVELCELEPYSEIETIKKRESATLIAGDE